MLCIYKCIKYKIMVDLSFCPSLPYGWIDDLLCYVLLNSVSVISGRWDVDDERLCPVELCLQLRRFNPQWGSNSVH